MDPATDSARRIVIVAGMPRAATTFLYHTLAKHPQAWVPPRKEVEYFSLNYSRGSAWYSSFFDGAGTGQVGFDISPIYFMDEKVPARILAFDPHAKVILLVRDPVEFVLSFFANRRGATHEDLRFADFLSGHTYVKDGQALEFDFRDGRIQETIEAFRETFGSNLLLCSYDLVREDPLSALKVIESFSGIPSHFDHANFENVRVNASDQKNIVWLNRLMHTKWFVDAVVRAVPKGLILKARYWVQTRRTSGGDASPLPGTEGDRALAEASLVRDRQYVADLFRDSRVLLGSGEPIHGAT